MRGTRRALARVAALSLAILIASTGTLGSSAAWASPNSPVVLVSTDGVSYQPALTLGLFNNAGLLVPGDVTSAALWIKNPTMYPATVRVNVGQISTSSADLESNMTLTAINTRGHQTITQSWSQLAQCAVLVEPTIVSGGAVLRIDFTLAMLNAPGLVAQHQNGSLTADVQMRDNAAGSFPISTCDPASSGPGTVQPAATHPRRVLGYTGDTFPAQLLLLGSVLVGVGWFLVVARSRRRRAKVPR